MKFPKALFALLVVVATAARAEVVGKARVIDGATLEVGGQTVRLHGIDAPSETQSCTQGGKPWPCGREATFALADQVGDHWLTCQELGHDGEGRVLARAQRLGVWRGDLVAPKDSNWRSLAGPGDGLLAAHQLCIRGAVEAGGVECPAFRGADGGLYSLLGYVGRPSPGMELCLCGSIAAVSHCMRGTPLNVAWRCRPEECPATLGGAGKN